MKIRTLTAALTISLGMLGQVLAADKVLLEAPAPQFNSLLGTTSGTVNGVDFKATGGTFTRGPGIDGFTGLGVSGGVSPDEIGVGESISLRWGSLDPIKSFSIALLFNGPEYGDFSEILQVQAFQGYSLVKTGLLTVDSSAASQVNATASLDMAGATITNLSSATQGDAGAWLITNPFGNVKFDKLVFTAVTSALCGSSDCFNQSDYALTNVTVVPEPQVYALMLAGLGAIGFMARRRRFQG